MPAPIGIFGGTFDPIHFGHLRLAEEARQYLRLAHVKFIPAAQPPHRQTPQVSAGQRVQMVRLACRSNPQFSVDERELARDAPSYSVDTLIALRAELGVTQPLCLLLGADAFLELDGWHRWRDLFDLAHIAVAHRPGFPQSDWGERMSTTLQQTLSARETRDPSRLAAAPAGCITTFAITSLDISATHIRDDLKRGASPRYLLPDVVFDYISQNRLYNL